MAESKQTGGAGVDVRKARHAEYVERAKAMATCLESAARGVRETLEHNPNDMFGMRMRLSEAQGLMPLIVDLSARLVELRVVMREDDGELVRSSNARDPVADPSADEASP